MITCPVCEHQQAQGNECDSCGKQLAVASPVPLQLAPMAELEGTQISGGRAEVQVQAMADLEVTKLRGGPDLPAQVVADLDRTALEQVGEVTVEAVGDLDTGRAADDGQRTVLPTGAVTCRYCKNVQSEGSVCVKCGMKLPYVVRAAPGPAAPTSKQRAVTVWSRCRACGAKARAGEKCGDCGHQVPMP